MIYLKNILWKEKREFFLNKFFRKFGCLRLVFGLDCVVIFVGFFFVDDVFVFRMLVGFFLILRGGFYV